MSDVQLCNTTQYPLYLLWESRHGCFKFMAQWLALQMLQERVSELKAVIGSSLQSLAEAWNASPIFDNSLLKLLNFGSH